MLTPTGLGPRKEGGINAVLVIQRLRGRQEGESSNKQKKRTFTSLQMAIKMDELTTPRIAS